jgi:hypothetical protein
LGAEQDDAGRFLPGFHFALGFASQGQFRSMIGDAPAWLLWRATGVSYAESTTSLEREWTKILAGPGIGCTSMKSTRRQETEAVGTTEIGQPEVGVWGMWAAGGRDPEIYEREVRDLPWGEYQVTVVMELYRVNCERCGVKAEKAKCCRARLLSAGGLRMRWGRPVRVRRYGEWRISFICQRGRCGRSMCII